MPNTCNESVRALTFVRHVELFNRPGLPELRGGFGRYVIKQGLAAQEEETVVVGEIGECYAFAQGVRISGLVGSSFVGFFSCLLVFFSFIF